jgi:hypothetical protein
VDNQSTNTVVLVISVTLELPIPYFVTLYFPSQGGLMLSFSLDLLLNLMCEDDTRHYKYNEEIIQNVEPAKSKDTVV